jgi:hypothetical protein
VELGTTQQREAKPGQGHDKGTASPACRGSAIGNRRPRGVCELAGAGYGAWQIAGSRPDRWLVGPVGGRALARLAGAGMPCRVAVILCRPESSRGGERREREEERKGPGIKLNFLKISNRNLKNFEHESFREFHLQLLF